MSKNSQLVKVHVNIEVSAASLQAVVANTKKKRPTNEQDPTQMDTADVLSALISRFLQEKDFEEFARDVNNYC